MTELLSHRVLLVDDEPAITKSLNRLLRKEGYIIDMCNTGAEGLQILETATEPFSLIISDQRMPEMSGSQFLEQASKIAPDTIRFLLTGYSDLQAVVDAVNKGKINRYLTKPWNDEALLLHVRQAIDEVELRRENKRLTQLTKRQNKQLYELGLSLDKKVKERTQKLKESNIKLEESFLNTVRLVLSLVEATNSTMGQYMRHVGRLSKSVAIEIGLPDKDIGAMEIAGQLHDIGMFGLPEDFLHKSEKELTGDDLRRYRQHPVFAAISLETVDRLAYICEIVLHHHERYDGKGFPEGLKGKEIHMGSRILAAVSDYCRIMHYWPKNKDAIKMKMQRDYGIIFYMPGVGDLDKLLQIAAKKILVEETHKKYDSIVVEALIAVIDKSAHSIPEDIYGLVPLEDLQPGMIVPQDLFMKDGRMLLAQSTVLDASTIRALQKIGQMKIISEAILVQSKG